MGAELKDELAPCPSKEMQHGGNGMAFRHLGTRRQGGSRPLDTGYRGFVLGAGGGATAREVGCSCEPGPQFRGSRARALGPWVIFTVL